MSILASPDLNECRIQVNFRVRGRSSSAALTVSFNLASKTSTPRGFRQLPIPRTPRRGLRRSTRMIKFHGSDFSFSMLSCTLRGPASSSSFVFARYARVSNSSSLRRHLCTHETAQLTDRPDFDFYPRFFSPDEQRVLLRAALRKLDSQESPKHRRRRKEYLRTHPHPSTAPATASDPVQGLFLPDELYDFQDARLSPHLRREPWGVLTMKLTRRPIGAL